MKSYREALTAGATLAAVMGLWGLLVAAGVVPARLLPSPLAVGRTLWDLLAGGELKLDVLTTLRRIAVGYVIGFSLGLGAGLLTGAYVMVDRTVGLWIRILRSLSPVALVPYFILLLGLSEGAKYAIVAWGVFFTTWIAAHVGIRSVHPQLINAARVLGMPNARVWFEVYPLASLPHILSGARASISIAFICAVVAEMAGAGATEGLGYRLAVAYQVFRADIMLGVLVVLGILGAGLDFLFVVSSRRLFPWAEHAS